MKISFFLRFTAPAASLASADFWRRSALLAVVCFGLAGCGGGGSSSAPPEQHIPPPDTAPSITVQPENTSVAAGSSATFTVVAAGDSPLVFQWLRGGADVPGANSSTFTLVAAQVSDNGSSWSVRVSNAAGQVLSAAATLSVQAPQSRGTLTFVAGSLASTTDGQGTSDGSGAAARFRSPGALTFDTSGNLYVVDSISDTIRKITSAGDVTTFAGAAGVSGFVDGAGSAARFNQPVALATGKDGLLYVLDGWELTPFSLAWQAIRRVSPQSAEVTTVGKVAANVPGIGLDASGNIYLGNFSSLIRFAPDNSTTTLTPPAAFGSLKGLTTASDGTVYFMEGNSVRKLTSSGVVVPIAGDLNEAGSVDGVGAQARFNFTSLQENGPVYGRGGAIVVDSVGNLYVGDSGNHTVRKVTAAGEVTTVAGVAGVAGNVLGSLPAGLYFPNGLALFDDKTLFVSSRFAILKISLP